MKFSSEVERIDNVIERTAITCKADYSGCFETIMELRSEFQRFCLSLRSWETQESLKYPLDVLAKTKRLGEIFNRIENLDMGGQHDLHGLLNPAYWPLVMSHDVLWNMLAFHARSDGEIVREIKAQQKRLPQRARFTLDETIQEAERKYGRDVDERPVEVTVGDVKVPASVWGHDREEVQVAGKARLACVQFAALDVYLDCFSEHVAQLEMTAPPHMEEGHVIGSKPDSKELAQTPKGSYNPFLLAFVIIFLVWRLSSRGRPAEDRGKDRMEVDKKMW